MTSFDYILLSLSSILIIRGLIKGFIREVLGLVSIVAGFVIAYLFSDDLAALISVYIDSQQGATILSYAALFIGSALLINYLARLLTSLSKAASLSFINRLLGGVFGLLKSVILLFVVWYLLSILNDSLDIRLPTEIANSQILTAFDEIIETLY